MKLRILLSIAVLGSGVFAGQSLIAADKEEEAKFACKCVVSGKPALEDAFVEQNGKKVYFCCTNCPKAFAKDPEKFATKVNHQWAVTGQIVQVACPLTGRKIDAEKTVEIDGATVAFCCANCQGKAEKTDDKIALVFADISKGFTLQDKCPVSGKPIQIDKLVEYQGEKVYFCCPNCPAAFEKDPEKYVAKLPQLAEKK